MMQTITLALTLASIVGSASGFVPSSAPPRAFVSSLYMAEKVVLADIVDTAVAAGSFKTLAAALGAADLVATLKGKGPFTVFAPTDAAFAKLPKGTLDDLLKPENKAKLASILTYHVLASKVMASAVLTMDGKKAATVNGKSVSIAVKNGKVTVDGAKVVTTDVKTSNGVIHIIDTVMIPK
jgi:transforming growth factor-beta-induced protein